MTEKWMVDDAGTLINMETRNTYDYMEDIVDLLNEQEETLEKIKKKSKEFKEHIQSEIRVAEHQIQNGEKTNKEHWIVRQYAYEELLEEMQWLLVWEGEIE